MQSPYSLSTLARDGAGWIHAQRHLFRQQSVALPAQAIQYLSQFFAVATLESVRVARTPRILNPKFILDLASPGQDPPLDFSKMDGIAFIDTIVFADSGWPPSDPLLFHELVHTVQYQLLGVDRFAERYVYGRAENGYAYERIPLEVDAYYLQEKFARGTLFSVEATVRVQLGI